MSLERKDVRFKLDPDAHRALTVVCEADHLDIAEFVEREVLRVIRERLHAASFIAQRTQGLGNLGSGGDGAGSSGIRGEDGARRTR